MYPPPRTTINEKRKGETMTKKKRNLSLEDKGKLKQIYEDPETKLDLRSFRNRTSEVMYTIQLI
jgi:hypothetical protein